MVGGSGPRLFTVEVSRMGECRAVIEVTILTVAPLP
jgi:hypothetical protein